MKHQLIYDIDGLNKQFKTFYRLEPQNHYEEIVLRNDNRSLTERTIWVTEAIWLILAMWLICF